MPGTILFHSIPGQVLTRISDKEINEFGIISGEVCPRIKTNSIFCCGGSMGEDGNNPATDCPDCEKFRERLHRLEDELNEVRRLAHTRGDSAALAESERKYRSLFEDSLDTIYISTPEGEILDMNPAGVRLFGYGSKEELLQADIGGDLYIDPEERKKCLELLERDGCLKDHELHLRMHDGTELVALETTTSVRDASGKIIAYRGFMRDVTERKKLEGQLLQAQRLEAVGRLAGGVAHDFNNLLTVIGGYCQGLLLELETGHPVHQKIGVISKAAESATGLTQQLLAFSRQQKLRPQRLDLNEMLREMGGMIGRLIGEDVTMICHFDPDAGQVKADRAQLEQVMMNLAVNSRDAMPDGGRLTIETSNIDLDDASPKWDSFVKPGSYVVLMVTDTGCGIHKDDLVHIFEPFFTTKDPSRGTGLGLSTTYGTIKQSGGYILADSTPGKGSRFTILLPRMDLSDTAEPGEPRGEPQDLGGTETVLLVEDNEMVKTMVSQILADHGYKVLSADDPEEALALCNGDDNAFDLLLTDVVMPGMNGHQLSLILQDRYPGIAVLFMSGYTASRLENLEDITRDHTLIRKPFNVTTLLTQIRQTLREHAQR